MKTPLLLLAFVATVSALCFPTRRETIFAKGIAKVKVYQEEDREGLRVVLDVEYKDFANQNGPYQKVELASSRTDGYGFYIIAGAFWPNCRQVDVHYRLRLYDDRRANYVLNETEVPREYVAVGGDNGKGFFETDLAGVVKIIS